MVSCQVCNELFKPKTKKSIYCSLECRKKAFLAGKRIREKEYRQANKQLPIPEEGIYKCLNCKKDFERGKGKGSYKYCSRECSFEHKKASIKKEKLKTCIICGKQYKGKCSSDCYKTKNRLLAQEYDRKMHAEKAFKCKYCSIIFVPSYKDKHRIFCSDNCSKKYKRNKEGRSFNVRAKLILKRFYGDDYRKHYQKIEPIIIYERDQWLCGICGHPIEKTQKSPLPNSPSIDHIIPLSLGGEHKPNNLRAAHLYCNSIRGNGGRGY